VTPIEPITSIQEPTFSVVVCAYTDARKELLTMCIGAIFQQLGSEDELIVVIDHNDALLEEVSMQYEPLATVVPNTNKQGL
jgi:glycosyltransferase involved in cell wall biosynthesis